ncbi:uncharacterized protein LOC141801395 isoform X2 [Halichoeres trimaculatus]|uniref:uncharacterized protein LOC141801395 isoform X2 n=1 Tax=Halichoeres trimaculatus TaxID=147232 RepID=UPI003D9FAA43
MKIQLLLPLTIAVSVITVGVMKIRKKEHDNEVRKSRFQDIKLRVTYDVLAEYQNDKMAKQLLLQHAEEEQKILERDVNDLITKTDTAKKETDLCQSEKNSEQGVLEVVDKEFNEVKASTEKEKTEWMKETESLKKQLEARSPACAFLKPDSQSASKLCGGEAEAPKEEAKAKEPKEEAKAEAPKEEAKAEAPKEEAKAEAPKEEAKAEAPKEEVKAEAPKEEAKAEAPKEEAPKAEAPKEEAKAEAPQKI